MNLPRMCCIKRRSIGYVDRGPFLYIHTSDYLFKTSISIQVNIINFWKWLREKQKELLIWNLRIWKILVSENLLFKTQFVLSSNPQWPHEQFFSKFFNYYKIKDFLKRIIPTKHCPKIENISPHFLNKLDGRRKCQPKKL